MTPLLNIIVANDLAFCDFIFSEVAPTRLLVLRGIAALFPTLPAEEWTPETPNEKLLDILEDGLAGVLGVRGARTGNGTHRRRGGRPQ